MSWHYLQTPILWNMGVDEREETSMDRESKAEMEDDVSIDATPGELAWPLTRWGAERREPKASRKSDP